MKSRTAILIGFALLLAHPFALQAQIPRTLSYQGVLTDASGNIKPDGPYSFTFRLYDVSSGGTALWTETETNTVKDGLFSTTLGDQTAFPASLTFDKPYWLGIEVESEELSPRIALTSSPYSFSALRADTAHVATSALAAIDLADGAVTSVKIQDGAVTPVKINTTGASSGQALIFNGSNLNWQTPSGGGLTLPYFGIDNSSVYAFDIQNDGTGGGISVLGNATAQRSIMVEHHNTFPAVHIEGYVTTGTGEVLLVENWSGSGNAGYFDGDVEVTGNLSKGGGSFKIDHPLDPENKYLYHSFVESPDMMNVYNGNIILNNNGEAIVELPEWFDALNKDFCYQLSCVGCYAPVYIAEEISNNSFKISGGTPGMKISWQVTGIRQDPYANENRIQVEVEKPEEEKGHYLHYKAYNQPIEKSMKALKNPELLEE